MKLGKIQFAKLIGQIQKLLITRDELSNEDIEIIDAIVEFNVPVPAKAYASCADVDDMLKAMREGRKIDAIKAYRSITGTGLKEGKDAIEANWLPVPALSSSNANLGDILDSVRK